MKARLLFCRKTAFGCFLPLVIAMMLLLFYSSQLVMEIAAVLGEPDHLAQCRNKHRLLWLPNASSSRTSSGFMIHTCKFTSKPYDFLNILHSVLE